MGRNKFVCVHIEYSQAFTGFPEGGADAVAIVVFTFAVVSYSGVMAVRVVEFRCHRVHHSCQLYVCIQAADHTFFEGVPCSSV